MISFIISLIPLLFIAYYFIILKRSSVNIYIKSLSSKKTGSICYNCSSDIEPSIKTNWFEKYQMILLIISMSFIFTNIILSSFFDIKIGSIPSNILLGFYWFMMIYRVRVSLRGYLKRDGVSK